MSLRSGRPDAIDALGHNIDRVDARTRRVPARSPEPFRAELMFNRSGPLVVSESEWWPRLQPGRIHGAFGYVTDVGTDDGVVLIVSAWDGGIYELNETVSFTGNRFQVTLDMRYGPEWLIRAEIYAPGTASGLSCVVQIEEP